MSRRAWYLLINGIVVAWFLATAVVVSIHRLIPAGSWLMVHLLLLGAVSAAILVWSQHFADAILRRAAPGGRISHGARLAGHSLGAGLVVAGIVTGSQLLILIGAVIVGAAVLAHIVLLSIQSRRALPARFAPLVRFYIVAGLALIAGIAAGVLMARAELSAEWLERLYPAHLALNLLGWIGLTVIGTIVLLWPTILHARITDEADRAARRALWLVALGLVLTVAGILAALPMLLAAGLLDYLGGLGLVVWHGVQQARQSPPSTFAAWSIAAAVAWFAGCVVAFGVVLLTSSGSSDAAAGMAALVTPFAGGFAAQIVLGALSHLLPVVAGGGPVPARRMAAQLDRGAVFRVATFNLGGLIYVLPVPSLVRVIVSLVLFGVLLSFLWFAIAGLRALKVEPKERRPASTAGAFTAAATVLVLAAAGGVALDPAAAGIGTAPAPSAGQATGQTTTVEVVMRDTRFTPDVIEVPAGDRLVIVLRNDDDMDHDLTLSSGIRSPRLGPGETHELDAGVITADLDGWCSIAGHRLLGMVLTIVAVGASPDAVAPDAGAHDHGTSGTPYAHDAEPGPGFEPVDAALPAAASGTVHEHTFTVTEVVAEVAPGVEQTVWTFGGTVPGPTLRGKVGDVFEITLVNDGTIGHSIDFHAGSLAPDQPMRTIAPGESLTYRFTATRAGIWLYHCSTMPMSLHIAAGMFGAVIIDPPGLPEADREYLLVQSEYYLGEPGGEPDAEAVGGQHPDLVVFNGYAEQYRFAPLEARVGERVRVWLLDAGPNRPSSFHVVGGQFDTVFIEGDYLLRDGGSTGVGGSQALALQPAQGGFVELVFPEAGHYPFVTHIMSDAEKGTSGVFRITD